MFLLPQIIVRQTERSGRGVFATDIIQPGAVIGDYLGIVTPADQGTDRYGDESVYDMWYSDTVDICPDPEEKGVHLLNTSCEPNCGMTALKRHTLVFALRRIFPGEELTYDYFLGPQDRDDIPGTDNCHCGSEFCRGTLYSNPQAYEEWNNYLDILIGNEPEQATVPFGEMLPPFTTYPQTIDDHPIYPLYGYAGVPPQTCKPEIFHSMTSLRKIMRETGKRLLCSDLGLLVEGITYGGHILMKFRKEKSKNELRTRKIEQDRKLRRSGQISGLKSSSFNS